MNLPWVCCRNPYEQLNRVTAEGGLGPPSHPPSTAQLPSIFAPSSLPWSRLEVLWLCWLQLGCRGRLQGQWQMAAAHLTVLECCVHGGSLTYQVLSSTDSTQAHVHTLLPKCASTRGKKNNGSPTMTVIIPAADPYLPGRKGLWIWG